MFGPNVPYNRKPPSGVDPNLSHRTLRNCISWFTMRDRHDEGVAWRDEYKLAQPGDLTYTSTKDAAWIATEDGIGWQINTTRANANYYLTDNNVTHGIGTGNFTFLLRVRLDDNTGTYHTGWSNGLYAPCLYLVGNTATAQWYHTTGQNFSTALTVGQWHTLTVVRQGTGGSDLLLYLDGALDATAGNAGNWSNSQWYVGYDGYLQDHGMATFSQLRLYNRALPAAEVRYIHNNLWAPFTRPLPVWINTAAAPGGWSKKIDGVSTYTKIDGLTAASGITKVNGVSA